MEYEIKLEAEKHEQGIQLQPEAYNQASGGTINITENGIYDVTKYQEAEVDVPVDVGAAFNTTITGTSGSSARYWYRERFVNWEVLPQMVFNIDPAVTLIMYTFEGVGLPYLKLVGGENITSVQYLAQNTEQLVEVDLSEFRPTAITDVSYAFFSCGSLQKLDLSGINTSKVTNMSYLGSSCSVLKYVNLSGWSTESITNNDRMFQFSRELEAVIIDSPSVFRLTNSNAFNGTPISGNYATKGYVYVPDNLVDEYKSATNWTIYADYIKPLSELPQEVKDVFGM